MKNTIFQMDNIINSYLSRHGFTSLAPKAVLFDMDGVLYNSMPNHAIAWKRCMAEYGLKMTEEEAFLYEGMRGVETIKIIAGKQWHREVSDEEAAKIYRRKSEIYSGLDTAKMIEGVYDLQKSITRRGWNIGVESLACQSYNDVGKSCDVEGKGCYAARFLSCDGNFVFLDGIEVLEGQLVEVETMVGNVLAANFVRTYNGHLCVNIKNIACGHYYLNIINRKGYRHRLGIFSKGIR